MMVIPGLSAPGGLDSACPSVGQGI